MGFGFFVVIRIEVSIVVFYFSGLGGLVGVVRFCLGRRFGTLGSSKFWEEEFGVGGV